MYRTKSDLMELEVALLKQLHEAGWTPFSRLTTAHAEQPDSRMLSFLQGGSVLNISLGYPADSRSEVVVQASVNLLRKSLPVPPDAGWIEFDESTQLRFLANTRRNLPETIDFFDKEMALDGWQAREAGRMFDDQKKRAFLPYVRDQQDVRLRLVALPDGRTRILAGEAEDTSWQVKNEMAATAEKPAEEKPGIEAADFVLPKGATAVKFDVDDKQIEFDSPMWCRRSSENGSRSRWKIWDGHAMESASSATTMSSSRSKEKRSRSNFAREGQVPRRRSSFPAMACCGRRRCRPPRSGFLRDVAAPGRKTSDPRTAGHVRRRNADAARERAGHEVTGQGEARRRSCGSAFGGDFTISATTPHFASETAQWAGPTRSLFNRPDC